MKNYPTTILGYFKNELTKQRENVKYFNRDFLGRFLVAAKSGDYSRVFETDFYNKNGGAYCVFLEIFHQYKKNMDRFNAIAR